MPDNLQPASLAWALAHVRRFGDTDIFPLPFEYECLAHDWKSVGSFLAGVDLTDYKIRPDSPVMVIKPGGGFRAATQLDPLDHLLYTAAIYEAAELIEKARVPADQRIAVRTECADSGRRVLPTRQRLEGFSLPIGGACQARRYLACAMR